MEHFKDFLHRKKINVKDILHEYVTINEKVDGSAFQLYNNNNIIYYGKRGNSPSIPTKNNIDIFDLLTNKMYFNTYNYFRKFENYLKLHPEYTILNFEIFESEYNKHIIKYKNKFKNNIVLLSGYNNEGIKLSDNILKQIANDLNVSFINTYFKMYLDEYIIGKLLSDKDIENNEWNLFNEYYFKKYNIDISNIEGIVLHFKESNKTYKIQNPVFQKKIVEHLSKENNDKQKINLEHIYDLVIDTCLPFNKEDSPVKRLLEFYMSFEFSEKDFSNIESELKKLCIFEPDNINMNLGNEIYYMLPDNINVIQYPNLLYFILLCFRNKRVKFPLYCSLEYQLNKVNKFLDNYIFNS